MNQINLFVIGISKAELKLLHGIVKLSNRRNTKINLLADNQIHLADVILIDNDFFSQHSFREDLHDLINSKAVVWIDNPNELKSFHTAVPKPFEWVRLPLYLVNAIKIKRAYDSQSQPSSASTLDKYINNFKPQRSTSVQQSMPENLSSNQVHRTATVATNKQRSDVVVPAKQSMTMPSVLVVDDSQVVREYLYKLLHERDYHVSVASDGADALRMFRPYHFQAVLMDVVMPDTDGYTACRRMRQLETNRTKRTPIVMLTSKSSPFDKIKGKMAGCDSYLTKPVALDKLMQVLNTHIAKVS